MPRLLFAILVLLLASPAFAITGNAPSAAGPRHAVMIVGSHGTFCTGAAIARDLVLTAAHCVQPGSDYKLVEFDVTHTPRLLDVRSVSRHPQFNLQTLLAHRATADVALLKMAKPLPDAVLPATLGDGTFAPKVGGMLTVFGYGLAVRGDGKTGGSLRAVPTGRWSWQCSWPVVGNAGALIQGSATR